MNILHNKNFLFFYFLNAKNQQKKFFFFNFYFGSKPFFFSQKIFFCILTLNWRLRRGFLGCHTEKLYQKLVRMNFLGETLTVLGFASDRRVSPRKLIRTRSRNILFFLVHKIASKIIKWNNFGFCNSDYWFHLNRLHRLFSTSRLSILLGL